MQCFTEIILVISLSVYPVFLNSATVPASGDCTGMIDVYSQLVGFEKWMEKPTDPFAPRPGIARGC